ncbi:type III secretion protein [Pseudomonas sp. D1-1]|uniref:type III secretion protein n=1 Tax=Pseudomonas sp. D1-1 TaxID=1040793 RepID=UPI003DA9EE21
MEFSEFSAGLTRWLDDRSVAPLDCWVDGANVQLAWVEEGVRCSIDVLDPFDASAPDRLMGILAQGGASVACRCPGALGTDPQSQCLVLVYWMSPPGSVEALLGVLETLANQRAAMLSLMHKTLFDSPSAESRLATNWHTGV